MYILADDIIKILLALLLGGLIGVERDVRDKAAGFRTLIFICIGSTLFTILSVKLASQGTGDITRISANIVSGVGFLGAGVILRESGQVKGLTTASTIWLVAALGMAVGAGELLFSSAITIIILIVLWFFPYIERLIEDIQIARTYEVTCKYDLEKYNALNDLFRKHKLIIGHHHLKNRERYMIISWDANGRASRHKILFEKISKDPDIQDFSY